jgi:hypothetical protein
MFSQVELVLPEVRMVVPEDTEVHLAYCPEVLVVLEEIDLELGSVRKRITYL